MSETQANTTGGRSAEDTLSFNATDVTGSFSLVASEVEKSLPVGAVAAALASKMRLPNDVPWALRDDTTSVFLEDSLPIGDQILPDAHVTITPKTHLG